jgi:hypothetical protein
VKQNVVPIKTFSANTKQSESNDKYKTPKSGSHMIQHVPIHQLPFAAEKYRSRYLSDLVDGSMEGKYISLNHSGSINVWQIIVVVF